jgi:uncharacterized protein YcbX
MEEHVRVAIYDVKQGVVLQELADKAKGGMLPIFQAQEGFVRYGLALLDDGTVASISVWESHDEAEAATKAAADWVAKNLADSVTLKNSHVGDFFFDEGP